MKKNKILLVLPMLVFSTNSFGFSEKNWVELILDSIETKDNVTWNYNSEKLKSYSKMVKDEDLEILKSISNNDDIQIAQASKYLLALQGNKTNDFLIDNYLSENNIKNGMYYINLNFSYTGNKDFFWRTLKEKEILSTSIVSESFTNCNGVNNIKELGGQVYTFNSLDDFFQQKPILESYSHADLMYLEMDLMDRSFPVDITLYPNKYVINKKNDENCAKPSDIIDYDYIQKILALYKQHGKIELLKSSCEKFDDNSFLKSSFMYLCN